MSHDGRIPETIVQGYALEPAQPRASPWLRWADTAGPHELELTGAVTAGSSPNAGLVVADRAVSRVHAELTPKRDGLWVRDLGSRNGTYIDGIAIVEGRVPPAGVLRMGKTELTVTYGAAETPKDLWPDKAFGPLLGRTAVMRELFAQMARVAASTAAVFVSGESGTGKELVARAIHDASARAAAPFVVVDCAALPPNLLESELFGHVRGAFTGAVAAHTGAFESAGGGTVFLDEVGELPLPLQPKLLRVLEAKMVRRLGETKYRKIDVRVLSATHRDLRTMVNLGAFREDLFFRLAVLPVKVPALRERLADLPLLLEGFLGSEFRRLTPELLDKLMLHSWPGNVRELRNLSERVAALGAAKAIALTLEGEQSEPESAEDDTQRMNAAPVHAAEAAELATAPDMAGGALGPELEALCLSGFKEFRDRWTDLGEREYLKRLMERTDCAPTRAAREAGLDRTYLYRLLRRHGM